jgi:hypothetical protein
MILLQLSPQWHRVVLVSLMQCPKTCMKMRLAVSQAINNAPHPNSTPKTRAAVLHGVSPFLHHNGSTRTAMCNKTFLVDVLILFPDEDLTQQISFQIPENGHWLAKAKAVHPSIKRFLPQIDHSGPGYPSSQRKDLQEMRCATKVLLPFHRLMSLMIGFERESRLQPFIISSEARVSYSGTRTVIGLGPVQTPLSPIK